MKNIAYIISRVSHSKLFEWTATLLSREKYRLVFILLHHEDTAFEQFLRKSGFKVYRLKLVSRRDVIKSALQIRRVLKAEKIDIVHTHLFEAGIAGQVGGRMAGVKRRIHTRHDAMIHHDSHPGAVKYDRLTNRNATEIIAITEKVKQILTGLEHVDPGKIRVIHHGFHLHEYADVENTRIEEVRNKYLSRAGATPVVGVVSRFIDWKGIQYVIPAFAKVLEKYPGAHLLLANAQGPYENELLKLLSQLPSTSFSRIVFEKDMAALYKLMDVFVHVPVSESAEAFGQVYIEAMAAGVPCVVTLSGIAPDYITGNENALVVPFRDAGAIAHSILRLVEDDGLRKLITQKAWASIQHRFAIERMIRELEACYDA